MKKYTSIYNACTVMTDKKKLTNIVDLGARHGEGYEEFGILHPESKYTFVEPSARCAPKIKNVIDKFPNKNIEYINGILDVKQGTAKFKQFENDNDQSGNFFTNRGGQYGKVCEYDVRVFDYNKLFSKISFVKCNIEGAEYELINSGFFDMVDMFVMEAHNNHIPGKSYLDIVNSLSDKFDLEVWGNTNYKYCFVNGIKKK